MTEQLDDILRAIVQLVTGEDYAQFANVPPGLSLGTLDAAQAANFAEVAVDLTLDRYALIYEADGTPTVKAVA